MTGMSCRKEPTQAMGGWTHASLDSRLLCRKGWWTSGRMSSGIVCLLFHSRILLFLTAAGRWTAPAQETSQPRSGGFTATPNECTYFYIKSHQFFLKGWCTTKREQANLEGQNVVRSVPGDTIPAISRKESKPARFFLDTDDPSHRRGPMSNATLTVRLHRGGIRGDNRGRVEQSLKEELE